MGAMLEALVAGDFAELSDRLQSAGLTTSLPAAAMLRIDSPRPASMRLLISAAVHGNETGPIEMMAQLLETLAQEPHSLAVDLLIVLGNPAAVAAARRFIDADLNRMFGPERGSLEHAAEAARADSIMQVSKDFFTSQAGQGAIRKWHLDLHTAIRPSRYPRFAIIPAAADDSAQDELAAWLGSAGIGAIVFNAETAPTYSAFTTHALGATSATLELGQVAILGKNDLAPLAHTQYAIARLLRAQPEPPETPGAEQPIRFRVAQEIVKRSDDFHMTIDKDTYNFTVLSPGALIATDPTQTVRVGALPEHLVFPNPDVLVGQRAGLMVLQIGSDTAEVFTSAQFLVPTATPD